MEPERIIGGRRALAGRLRALPRRERLVLLLYYADSLTMAETGLALGFSEEEARGAHRRALEQVLGTAVRAPQAARLAGGALE